MEGFWRGDLGRTTSRSATHGCPWIRVRLQGEAHRRLQAALAHAGMNYDHQVGLALTTGSSRSSTQKKPVRGGSASAHAVNSPATTPTTTPSRSSTRPTSSRSRAPCRAAKPRPRSASGTTSSPVTARSRPKAGRRRGDTLQFASICISNSRRPLNKSGCLVRGVRLRPVMHDRSTAVMLVGSSWLNADERDPVGCSAGAPTPPPGSRECSHRRWDASRRRPTGSRVPPRAAPAWPWPGSRSPAAVARPAPRGSPRTPAGPRGRSTCRSPSRRHR